MFEYMTAQEAANKWNISVRRGQRFCKENRIDGQRYPLNIVRYVALNTSLVLPYQSIALFVPEK